MTLKEGEKAKENITSADINALFDESLDEEEKNEEQDDRASADIKALFDEGLEKDSDPEQEAVISQDDESENSTSRLRSMLKQNEAEASTLDPEISKELAGYNAQEDSLLQQEDMLLQDEEDPSERSFSEKGLIRALFILGATGIIVLIGVLFWNLVLSRDSPQVAKEETPTEEEAPFEQDETGELKAQMAFNEQRRTVRDAEAQESKPAPEPLQSPPPSSPPPESEPESPPTSSTSRSVPVFSSPPAPQSESTSESSEEEEVDPFARWNQLASLGQSQMFLGTSEQEEAEGIDGRIGAVNPSPPASEVAPTPPTLTASSNTRGFNQRIPTVVISDSSSVSPPLSPTDTNQQFSSPGERGIILNRRMIEETAICCKQRSTEFRQAQLPRLRPELRAERSRRSLVEGSRRSQRFAIAANPNVPLALGNSQRSNRTYKQVPIGTTVSGKVAVPMYWDEGEGTALQQKYVIVLNEPLRSASGEVALPEGTALITEIVSVSPSRLVNQQVVALVFEDDGQITQHEINRDALSIRGANNEPLIASGYFNPGADIAQQDILISILSSVGKIGEIINLPQTVSSSSASSGGGDTSTTTSTTTTTREEPDLLGAALQGFFQPLADTLRQRSQTQTDKLLSRANIAVVPKGTPVSIVVESFLYVQRGEISTDTSNFSDVQE